MFGELLLGFILTTTVSLHAISKLFKPRGFLLSEVAMWFVGFSFGLAPIIAFAFGSKILLSFEDSYIAYISVSLYCLGLFLSGQIIKSTNKILYRKAILSHGAILSFINYKLPKSFILLCYGMFVLPKLYAISRGGGISGLDTYELNISIPYPIVILSSLLNDSLTVLLSIIVFLWLFTDKRRNIILSIIILLTLFIFAFIAGRRQFLYLLSIFLICYKIYFGKVNFRIISYALALIISILLFISPLILGFRLQMQSRVLGATDVDIGQQILESISSIGEQSYREGSNNNLTERPLGVRVFLLSIIEAQESREKLLGDAFLQEQSLALPRFLRLSQFPMNPKHYVQLRYGLPIKDDSHNVVSSAVADFGIIGALPYGFIMGFFFNIPLLFCSYRLEYLSLFPVLLYCTFLLPSINFELTPGFQLSLIRNVIILFFIFRIFKTLSKLFYRRRFLFQPKFKQ